MRFSPVALLPVALALVGVGFGSADDKKLLESRGWGRAIDPDGDCLMTEEKGKLTVKVPGSMHDLYPGQKDPKKRNNAPRVLTGVSGRFLAQVKVTAEWKPGGPLPGANTHPYNGAGLVVWASDTEFVRFERNVWVTPDGPMSFTTPLQYANGQQINAAKSTRNEFFKDQSTWLRVERDREKLTTSISHDGEKWIETSVLTARFPESVLVGVTAINSSDKEFVVEFEQFGIVGRP
jgi:regulation of enolase protein 1 (concanavalin A-like superfamily)